MIQFFSHPNEDRGVEGRQQLWEGGNGIDNAGKDGVEEGVHAHAKEGNPRKACRGKEQKVKET